MTKKKTPPLPLKTAMLLAAGRGERMRPLTDRIPKPLVPVQGRPLIDHAIDRLVAFGVQRVVVNTHYLADLLEAHLSRRKDVEIVTVREAALLETGGGVVNALSHLGKDPILVLNADSLWLDGMIPTLERLARRWDGSEMSALLLLERTAIAVGYEGQGDYFADPMGKLTRRSLGMVAPYAYAGVQILDPKALAGREVKPFRLTEVWDTLQEQEKLYGLVHDGLWFHVGTEPDLAETEHYLSERRLVLT